MAIQETEHHITMNDGIRLEASVCVPGGDVPDGGWPGLLFIHGHGENNSKAACLGEARRYAGRGYLAVSYSVRGQGGSEGLCFHLGAREIFDLQDVIDWVLEEQPVHPERFGVVGSSQGGWHSWMAAAHHPKVATAVPQNIETDMAAFAVRDGMLSTWFMTRTMRRRIMTAGLQDLARQWALDGNWHLIQEWVDTVSPDHFVDRIQCPILVIHGWDDRGMPGNRIIETFNRLNVPKRMYLGGGGHDGSDAGHEKLLEDLVDRWLDHWLRGEANGIMDEPAVICARKPSWEPTGFDTFPPGYDERTVYLRPDLTLSDDPPTEPDIHANVANVPSDPDYTLKSAIYDDLEGVADGLRREETAFNGEPLSEAVDIAGVPRFVFHMLSNRAAFQVHADLMDVAPDGEASRITRGQYGTRQAEPGKHTRVELEGRAILYRVEKGHHLRLVVSNYDADFAFPFFEPFCARLYHDNSRPSHLVLPLQKSQT